jgi:hypothetical protein
MKPILFGLLRGLGAIIVIVNLLTVGMPVQGQSSVLPSGSGLDSQGIPYTPGSPAPAAPLPAPAASGGSATLGGPGLLPLIDDRYNSNPTGWAVYEHQTATDVTNTINSGYRLVDISIETYTPGWTFTAVYVHNSGSYAKSWWWYYNVDVTTLSSDLSTNNARLISVKAVDTGGGAIRFAAVMIANTGADAKAWWWYVGESISNLSSLLTTNNARMTQVSAYATGGTTQYVAVMISNTGADAAAWWWYVNLSGSSLASLLSTNVARLIDLDVDPSTGNFNAVMVSCSTACPMWWWYYNVTTANLLSIAGQDGARIIDASTTSGCGDRCWSFILINNSNAITSRVGEMLRSQTDGTVGLYLKQVGGGVLANLMDSSVFEPASAIKAVTHLYTMRQLQAGTVSLTTLITKYLPPVGSSCPVNTPNGTETIQTADREMMWHSDNTRTRELNDYFGYTNVNLMASSLGMVHTSINHIIGCGGPIPDQTTLDDLAVLYEGVANGTFVNAAHRSLFFSQMAGKSQFASEGYDWTGLWTTDIPNLINQEAPASMTAADRAYFRSQMDLAYKAGNYKLCGPSGCNVSYVDDVAIFGWAKIPFCDAGGPRQFVFGTYIYDSTSDTGSTAAFNSTKAELLREQIHAGLASCGNRAFLPLIRK